MDAQRQRRGRLAVKTHELHYTAGMVHVGIYCVRDAVFEVSCHKSQAPRRPASARARPRARRPKSGTAAKAWDPSAPGPLEEALARRARAAYDTRYSSFLLHGTKVGGGGGGDGGAEWRPPGELHHARIGGDWYAGLRHVLEVGEATPRRKPPGYVSFPVAVASPRARPQTAPPQRAAAPASASASPPASPRAEYERPWSARKAPQRPASARPSVPQSPRAAVASRPSSARSARGAGRINLVQWKIAPP